MRKILVHFSVVHVDSSVQQVYLRFLVYVSVSDCSFILSHMETEVRRGRCQSIKSVFDSDVVPKSGSGQIYKILDRI